MPARAEYDYQHQAWTVDGLYVRCGHTDAMRCACYGRRHEGETVTHAALSELVAARARVTWDSLRADLGCERYELPR